MKCVFNIFIDMFFIVIFNFFNVYIIGIIVKGVVDDLDFVI